MKEGRRIGTPGEGDDDRGTVLIREIGSPVPDKGIEVHERTLTRRSPNSIPPARSALTQRSTTGAKRNGNKRKMVAVGRLELPTQGL